MSAAAETLVVKDVGAGVLIAVRRLHFRRRLCQAIIWSTTSLACALFAFSLAGLVDDRWPLPRAARLLLLSLILLTTLCFTAYSGWLLLRRRALPDAAQEIERAAGREENALVTLAENLDDAGSPESRLYIFARLENQARRELSGIDERLVVGRVKALRRAGFLLLVLLFLLLMRLIAPVAFTREVGRVLLGEADVSFGGRAASNILSTGAEEMSAPASIKEVHVRVVPPAYSGLGVEEISGDAPVRALAGSLIEVTLDAGGRVEGASLSYNGSASAMRALGDGRYTGAFTAGASGALEARLVATENATPPSFVRAVEVYTDAAPEARITEPQSDQLLRTLPGAPVAVRWEARDDLGVAMVALKYIKSRGEGDSAKFTNGEIAIGSVERASAREWRGTSSLDLQRLDMQPGDTLVFWVEARDRNPASNNAGRSASLAIALASPELAKLNLSDLMPNEIGRFLLSERQIIIHTEKLHKERAKLSANELKSRALDIAAEQRDFKNSFNDYIRREGEGEEEQAGANQLSVEEQVRAAEDERTAPHMHGIPEPPSGAPTSVKELTYAIRAMWDAEEALSNADTSLALKVEQEALAHLKRAQSAVRYIPPILPQSKPLDLKRRYAGELAEIKTRLERLARRADTKESVALRAALSDAYSALGDLQETLGVSTNARSGALGRATERAGQAAARLLSVQGGDHAATIAEAAGQLRVVESELSRMDAGGSAADFASRLSKPLALLTQAASNLFAIAESRTRAGGGADDASLLLPTDDTRAADYFRRLAGGGR